MSDVCRSTLGSCVTLLSRIVWTISLYGKNFGIGGYGFVKGPVYYVLMVLSKLRDKVEWVRSIECGVGGK